MASIGQESNIFMSFCRLKLIVVTERLRNQLAEAVESQQRHIVVRARDANIQRTTPVGFKPTRGDPIGLAGRRFNHSAKVSMLPEITRIQNVLL